MVDNTVSGGEVAHADPGERAQVLTAFNRHVAADARTVQVVLTVREGVTLIRRRD
ncbi:MAG: hypothetical protein H0U79_03955 [Solirubrobacterales bacterium]|nr:hypothetical protein [Solirubrobacterales bacterium]